jgi:hypothetical protein
MTWRLVSAVSGVRLRMEPLFGFLAEIEITKALSEFSYQRRFRLVIVKPCF